ncbi:metal ABC transporter substrate-binding protein [Leucobacter chromiiresistens]|uniref:Manganese/iron transport system substrate-binding protein n=1 Tax=Leucobacter chromiiresistens TaxID=1079994 RepID=A0A1H0Y6G4_9MICO|nr:metal ABC transporter substrate-binding protein [Leucobacter chromiiresistens]SDQ10671.1 manganese/iron transport system substrate-binding protein [Leucobacter chromiiresistens]
MTPHPRALKPAVLAGAALASLLALTACSGGASADQGGGAGGLKVVATTTQLTDFASEVGGDDIELTGLLSPNASAHHFDPSPADLLALGEADVLIVNGANLETFVDDAVDASGFDGTIITAADGIDLDEAKHITAEGGETESHDHEHADEEHADESEHDHEHDHEHAEDAHAEHDHDHGDLNPHIWTSPKNAIGMVAEIADGLAAADAEHADGYEQRAGDYTERLQQLDAWVAAQFERVPAEERVLVSGHDSLRYYLHEYGIEFVGSILPSFEDNAEPSAADIDALVAAIRERGVKAVFVESSMSPKLAQTIADEAGVEVVDSENLYADSLGAPDSDGATYIGATVHNTALILDAWGAQVDAVPDSLQG